MAADVAGGIVMLSIRDGKYFSLNETAAAIWRRLEHPIRTAELCDAIAGEFEVSRETADRAVLAFVDKLFEQQLIITIRGTGNDNG